MATNGAAHAPIPSTEPSAHFPTPLPASTVQHVDPPAVTAEQEAMLQDLIDYLSSPTYEIPSLLKAFKAYQKARGHPSRPLRDESGSGASSMASTSSLQVKDVKLMPLTDVERCWLSREQLLRFLRATKWIYKDAVLRVEETLIWRREFGVDELTAEHVSPEGESGKQILLGFDNNARPCYHMYPYRQNTKYSPRQIQFVVWYLERTIDLMGPDVETLCLCIDFGADLPTGGGQPTSLGAAKTVLYSSFRRAQVSSSFESYDAMFEHRYYGERLGRAICVNVPWVFWTFYKLVGPWVDPATKEKIIFTRQSAEARTFVPVEQLERSRFGGDLEFAYNHEHYFPRLATLASERRAATFANWQKMADGKIGFSERLTRPAYTSSLSGMPTSTATANSDPTYANGLAEGVQALSVDAGREGAVA